MILRTTVSSLMLMGCLAVGLSAVAQDTQVKVETVLSGLDNPSGIAVQPRTGDIFVSDSAGLRVVKFSPATPGQSVDVITGFPESTYGTGPVHKIGPLGLAFLSRNSLVVGGGGLADGAELLRFYELPAGDEVLSADNMSHVLGPLTKSEETTTGEGNFYDLAVTSDAIYITSNGDDTKGWVLKVDLKDGKPAGELKTFIATKVATEVDAPVGIEVEPGTDGPIIVGQMGEITKPGDSLLTFYDPIDGKMLMNLETGLFDITALAYSPSGKLYTTDYAWMDTAEGGLFRLDETDGGVVAVKLTSLDKPTAMAFGADGALYITVFGTAEDGSDEKSGKVLKITGDL